MMLYRTLFRSAIASGAVVGLAFLFAPLLPLYISVAAVTVIGSLAVTKHKINVESSLDDVPVGDLEYYKQPKANLLERLENLVASPFVALVEKIEENSYKKLTQESKTSKSNNQKEISNEENSNVLESYTIENKNETIVKQEIIEKKNSNTEEKTKSSDRTL